MWKITYFVCVLISFACFLFLEVEGRGGRGGGGGGRSSISSRVSRGGAGGSSSGSSGGGSASPAIIGIVMGVVGTMALTTGVLCLVLCWCKKKRSNPSLPASYTKPVFSRPVIARAANTSVRSATQPGHFKAPSAGHKQGAHEKVWITPAPGSHTIRAGQALDVHYSNRRSSDTVMGNASSYSRSSAGTQISKKPLPSF